MPTEFTHLFVSGWLGKTWTDHPMPRRFWALAAACSIIPDIDIIGFYFGIRYTDLFGHRGFTHSLSFALLVSVLVVVLGFPEVVRFTKQWFSLALFFFLATASNGFLDSMSDKGLGVGFFMPFDNARYVMFWRPLTAWPLRPSGIFRLAGLKILLNEIFWIWLPLLVVYSGVSWYRRSNRTPGSER